MLNFIYRLLITCGIIWLAQILLDTFKIREPAKQIIFVVVVIIMVLWLVGAFFINLPLS